MGLRVAVYLLLLRLCTNGLGGSIIMYPPCDQQELSNHPQIDLYCKSKTVSVTKVCDSVSRNAMLVKYLVRY